MAPVATTQTAPAVELQDRAAQILGDKLAVKVERAAELLDCHRSQVYRLLDSGALEAISFGGSSKSGKRVSVPSLLSFIASGGVERDHAPSAAELLAASRSRRGPSRKFL